MKEKCRQIIEKAKILRPPVPWQEPIINKGSARTVVLLHGLWRSVHSVQPLADFLHQEEGVTTIVIPYQSMQYEFEQIVSRVNEQIEKLVPERDISFVTHSLGGVILRGLLQSERSWGLQKAVMLAPPHHGSQIVDWLSSSPIRHVLGPASKFLQSTSINEVVPPLQDMEKMAVIMGNSNKIKLFDTFLNEENDGIVSVEDGWYPELASYQVKECDHTFMMHDIAVKDAIKDFLNL